MALRNQLEAYPETLLSTQLLQHQHELLQFLFFTNYDIVYETFELKHGSYSNRNQGGVMVTKFKNEEIMKYYQAMSEKMHVRVLREDIDLDKQLAKLEVLWHNKNWPPFHRYYFLKYLITASIKNMPQALAKEESLIRTEQHIYLPVFKSINAREACLRQIKKQLASLEPNDVHEYIHVGRERLFNERRKVEREKYRARGYQLRLAQETHEGKLSKTKFEVFGESFTHLTKLTLYAVDLIMKWKEYIWALSPDARKQKQRMEYYFYDDNYLLKILSDLGFMRVSFLTQFYQFAPKNDPFLLQPLLAFQKKAEKTVEHQLLKQIFMPEKQLLPQILAKLQLLSEEYRHNIRSRKVYDLNVLKKPALRAEQKELNNQNFRQNVSKLVLKKIESPVVKKAKSVGTFRVRQKSRSQPRKDQIVVEFKRGKSPMRSKIASMPGEVEKQTLDRDPNNPLKNSVVLQKNENYQVGGVNQQMLSTLKAEVVRRVKEDFSKAKTSENKALQMFIESKLSQAIKGIFPFQPEQQMRHPLQLKALSFPQHKLAQQVEGLYRRAVPEYATMQLNQLELMEAIEQLPFLYAVGASMGQEEMGRMLCGLDLQSPNRKTIKVLYLHFEEVGEVETLMMEFVKFLWKYQNSFEIHFRFMQPTGNDTIKMLLQNIENTLFKECIVARKDIYSNVSQVRFIFKRLTKNVNYLPNPLPMGLRLDLSLLYSHKKLMLENRNEAKHLQNLCYDYLLMQAIRRYLSTQDIVFLRERVSWKGRHKMIMDMVREEQECEMMRDTMHQVQASNVSQLHNYLAKQHRPAMEASDLVKENRISWLWLPLQLQPDFKIKSVYAQNHQLYHRIQVNGELPLIIDEEKNEFYLLPLKDNKDYQMLLFDASHFLHHLKDKESNYLSLYIYERVTQCSADHIRSRAIKNLWTPMCRYPSKYKEREETFIHTARAADLHPLKKDLLIGEHMEWLTSMEMDNSIVYPLLNQDVLLRSPVAVGVILASSRTPLYCRVFT